MPILSAGTRVVANDAQAHFFHVVGKRGASTATLAHSTLEDIEKILQTSK